MEGNIENTDFESRYTRCSDPRFVFASRLNALLLHLCILVLETKSRYLTSEMYLSRQGPALKLNVDF